jgi:Transglycosylase
VSRRRGLLRALAALAAAGLASALAAAWLGPPWLERTIRARIERAAHRRGLDLRLGSVDVGRRPLLALEGLRVGRPGAWSLTADAVEVDMAPWGGERFAGSRVALGRLGWSAPGIADVEVVPSLWDLGPSPGGGLRGELLGPARGVEVTWRGGAEDESLDLRATDAPLGRLLALRRDRTPILDAGRVDGTVQLDSAEATTRFHVVLHGRAVRVASLSEAHDGAEGPVFGPPTDVALELEGTWQRTEGALDLPRWSLTTAAAALSGSLAVTGLPRDPDVSLSFEADRVDLSRLFRTSGIAVPEAVSAPEGDAAADLGSVSVSARVRGRLDDAPSFTVSQRIDFTPPPRPLPEIEKLRGDFVHEVAGAGGEPTAIDVSAASPDFVPLGDVPPLFVRTLLLGEDSGFFDHPGIDLSELPAAILTNWSRGGAVRGASTITQQLAKNLFLSREKRLGRKLQELALALLLETTLDKQRILEIYLNVIEWGPGLYGLRPAARRYFAREPRDLTPAQMAFLVALIPGPVKYQASFADGTPSPGFRPLVDNLLAKLRSVDALTEEQYRAALADSIAVLTAPPAAGAGGAPREPPGR